MLEGRERLALDSRVWHAACVARGREKAKTDRGNYYKKRQQDKKAHMKRTAKGQPVTKHLISSILDKLQNE